MHFIIFLGFLQIFYLRKDIELFQICTTILFLRISSLSSDADARYKAPSFVHHSCTSTKTSRNYVIEATLTKLFFLFTHFSNSEWNAADATERKRPWVIRFVTHARSKTRSIIAVAVVNLHKRTQCTAVKLHLECGYSSTRENNQTHIAAASKLLVLSKHSHSAPATWFRCVRLFVS